jgi:Zn-dependent protease with chaperone function
MHFSLILCAVAIAGGVRLLFLYRSSSAWASADWSRRWQHALGLFLFPPLLLLMTAIAVLDMGKAGQMLGFPVGEIGFAWALVFLGLAVGCLVWRGGQAWGSLQKIRQSPVVDLQNITQQDTVGYLLDMDLPFAAQVGLWQSKLVVSRGLWLHLLPEQVAAVLAHEQAHAHYRDTFWFFWLGWLRQLTVWLPHTEALWQELLLLREIRADRWAAQQTDALLIAESLLQMAQLPYVNLENACAAMGSSPVLTRLEERIEALLLPEAEAAQWVPVEVSGVSSTVAALPWFWLLVALMPLLTVVLHH